MTVDGVWHNVYDIAKILGIGAEDAASFLRECGLQERIDDDDPLFQIQSLPALLAEFRRSRRMEDRRYSVPSELRDAPMPWARTLVRLYEQYFSYPRAVSPAQGQLLKWLVLNVQPRTVIEIGTFVGISTIWLAAGLSRTGACVHTIDTFEPVMPAPPAFYHYLEDPHTFAEQALQEAGVRDLVHLHRGTSASMAQQLSEDLMGQVDLLLIDGDHSVSGCLSDFLLYFPLLRKGGYLVLHDIYPKYCHQPGPRYLIDTVVRQVPWLSVVEVDTSPTNFGLAIIRKIDEKEQ